MRRRSSRYTARAAPARAATPTARQDGVGDHSETSTCGSSPEETGTGRKPCGEGPDHQADAEHRLEQRLGDEGRGQRRVARALDAAVQEPELDDVAAARRDDAVEARRRRGRRPSCGAGAGWSRRGRRRAGSCASRACGRPGRRGRARTPSSASRGSTLAARWNRSSSAWLVVRRTSLSMCYSVLTTHRCRRWSGVGRAPDDDQGRGVASSGQRPWRSK